MSQGAVFDSLNVNSGIENYIRYHKNGQIQIRAYFTIISGDYLVNGSIFIRMES